jgi:ubiquinone/menaquinone biosynthesis C-methylase UbiE
MSNAPFQNVPTDDIDLPAIRRLYRGGTNIIEHLRRQLGASYNTEQLVETSYDMQAGSYVRFVEASPGRIDPYRQELAQCLAAFVEPDDTVVDVGTGEMTTLATVAATGYAAVGHAYALDISLSRLVVGRRYLQRTLAPALVAKIQPVVSTLFKLPFADDSVDLVWTSHALEPNGSRELEAIRELARVSRRHIVLFEPSYERSSDEGRARMDRLGYIKNLPGVIGQVPGLSLEQVLPIATTENPLNPTHAYIIRKAGGRSAPQRGLCCPLSRGPLEAHEGYMFARASLLAYPVIEGIPVLRVEKSICASILDIEEAP